MSIDFTTTLIDRAFTHSVKNVSFQVTVVAFGLLFPLLAGCSRSDVAAKTPTSSSSGASTSTSVLRPGYLVARPIGNLPEPNQAAWISDLTIADLDGDGLKDVICCDARLNRICWIRQVRPGEYVETPIGDTVLGPAHVSVVDMNGDGHLDVLVACMGKIPPNNDKIGSVVILENDGHEHFTNHVIIENTYRVTDVEAADFNGDGKLDLAVAQFGYYEGQIQWLENLGNWKFAEHPLLGQAGAIHAPIMDINNDRRPDIVSIVAQDWEEVWAFENRGNSTFSGRVLHGSTNKDYGSSGLTVADVDGDGLLDIVYSNGDGFDYATPGARPWHGLQWLHNDGGGKFTFHRIGDFPGAFSPAVVDLNGDGFKDIVSVSGFNDWSNKDAIAMICFENDGHQNFTPRVLAYAPTHMIVVKAADMKNDGGVELVTGCLAFYPPFDRAARVMLWERAK